MWNPFKSCPVKAYWWCEVPNFGDALAPLLLEHFADIRVEWDTISHARVASIGSILEHIPPLWDGYVLGSGKLMEFSRLHLHTKTATILALRGPLSARGVPGNFALGDPGLLANELVGPQEKLWDLGIVPHWQDDKLAERPGKENLWLEETQGIILPRGLMLCFLSPQHFTTSMACRPFFPWATSNSTSSPS